MEKKSYDHTNSAVTSHQIKCGAAALRSETEAVAAGFHSSISFDSRLYQMDILGSIAHAKMLGAAGIIDAADSDTIVIGLKALLSDIDAGAISFQASDEDVHMGVERLLTANVSAMRARNCIPAAAATTRVALDARMFVRQASCDMAALVKGLMRVLVSIADNHLIPRLCPHTRICKRPSRPRWRII